MANAVSNAPDAVTAITHAKQSTLGAVVMGGDYRALGLVRSLGRCGVPVFVINQADQRIAGFSRYASRVLFYPDWEQGDAVDFLLKTGLKYNLNHWLLFPTADDSVRLVSTHHERLSGTFQLTVPPWEILQHAVDKRLMHEIADKVGVNHPKTIYPRSRDDLARSGLTFPVIVKPITREQFNKLTVDKAWPAENMNSLVALYDEACRLLPPEKLMVQEMIPGGGESQFSYAAVCKDGRPLVSLVARRTRQFPIDFGRASTFVETIDEPGVIEPSERLLAAVKYTGLVEVEFKRDPRTGEFKLLDINPRVWGWYSLCETAGVNFAYLLWLLYQGKPLPEVRLRPNVRWMRLTTDLLAAFSEMRHTSLTVREYLRSLRQPRTTAIFSSDDLLPALLEMPLLFFLFVKRLFRGKGI